ncbi:hypothetical protein pb186bvf_000997 [Paramecium bursaria]
MEEYLTIPGELQRVIDCIPVPDITVSSISQQSNRLTPQERKRESRGLTNQQFKQIQDWNKQNIKLSNMQPSIPNFEQQQNTVKNFKNFTLGSFNAKENDHVARELKLVQQDDVIKHNSKLRVQLIDQQKIIENQMNQIANLNNKIQNLQNEVDSVQEEKGFFLKQFQILTNWRDESNIQIQDLQEKLDKQNLVVMNNQEQFLRLQEENILLRSQCTKQSTQTERIKTNSTELQSARLQIDPELLSEDETLGLLLNLLSKISKSQRMIKIVRRNRDFKQFILPQKKSNPSLSTRYFLQSPKQAAEFTRKLSFNQENFKYMIKSQYK